jgi:hypothetical protein
MVQQGITDFPFPQIVSEAYEIMLSFANSVDFAFLCGVFVILTQVIIGILFKVKIADQISEAEPEAQPENKEEES